MCANMSSWGTFLSCVLAYLKQSQEVANLDMKMVIILVVVMVMINWL